jgi:hypothetical protein
MKDKRLLYIPETQALMYHKEKKVESEHFKIESFWKCPPFTDEIFKLVTCPPTTLRKRAQVLRGGGRVREVTN